MSSASGRLEKLRSQSGQATMEAVLVMVVATMVTMKIGSYFRDNGLLASVVEGPWSPIRGMIEDGVWKKHTISKEMHPNHKRRHQSTQGDST